MFLLNSCLGQFSAACRYLCRHPFSRSYGVILPSSLTMLLPPALGFSPHPPVSVYGTGSHKTIAAFLDSGSALFATCISLRITACVYTGGLPPDTLTACAGLSFSGSRSVCCVPTVLFMGSTGISTCCPSATTLVLALGPDLPGADQLYPGNLGYSAMKILTSFSLLIPAFSLPYSPQLLIGTASFRMQCSSTNHTYV